MWGALSKLKRSLRRLRARRRLAFDWIRQSVGRGRALAWQKIYSINFAFRSNWIRSRRIFWFGIASASLVVPLLAVYFVPAAQTTDLWGDPVRVATFREILVNVGTALLGASVVGFSFILFALQVNVERMPHGLFARLGSDRLLVLAFGCSFLLAVAIAAASFVNEPHLTYAMVFACWSLVAIPLLFVLGYNRSLSLISPVRQLGLIVSDSRRHFRIWRRRAERARPLVEMVILPTGTETIDTQRLAYFTANRDWTLPAKLSIQYALNFSRRYSAEGDHGVSAQALLAIVAINAAYVGAKGRTFLAVSPLFFDSNVSSDDFISESLEGLRQNVDISLARSDEEFLEQNFRAITDLVILYSSIEYGSPRAPKTHAHLALGYLKGAVGQLATRTIPDPSMEGLRLLGRSALTLLASEGADTLPLALEAIETAGVSAARSEATRPVTLTAIEQVTDLLLNLLRTKRGNVGYAAGEIQKTIVRIGGAILNIPDSPLTNIHATYLSPYFSATSTQALLSSFARMVEWVGQASADSEQAAIVAENIEEWADELPQTIKVVLLDSVRKQSPLTFHLLHWILAVSQGLITLAEAPACADHTGDELRRHALWLVSLVSWIPRDEQATSFVSAYDLSEMIFRLARSNALPGREEYRQTLEDLLLSWGLQAGRYSEEGQFELALFGVAVLSRGDPLSINRHVQSIIRAGETDRLPRPDVLRDAANTLRTRANAGWRQREFSLSLIENDLARADRAGIAQNAQCFG